MKAVVYALLHALALLVAMALCTAAHAQAAANYPSKPITLIVPFPAGGSTDLLGRMLGNALSKSLGQQVVVENVSGASGVIGMTKLMRASPDGYTLGIGTIGTHVIVPALSKKPPYDPLSNFEPVGMLGSSPMILITRPNFPATTLPEFVKYLEANKSKVSYGSAGVGTQAHYGCVMLLAAIKQEVTHVPYRGIGPAIPDLISGQIDFICDQPSTTIELVKSGKLKALASLSSQKVPQLPKLASAASLGYPDTNVRAWSAVFAPKGTPAELVTKLNAAMKRAFAEDQQLQERAKALAFDLPSSFSSSPASLSALIVLGARNDGALLRARKEFLD